jgi:hypothetical protein
MHLLSIEKAEGERSADFEERLFENAYKLIMQKAYK